jgi:hypothetical protein
MSQINSSWQLAKALGVKPDGIAKRLFKDTRCGICKRAATASINSRLRPSMSRIGPP